MDANDQRRSVSVPLTGALQTVPAYVSARSVEPAGTAVPLSANVHPPPVPLVVQFIVVPLSVPEAEPLTGMLPQVAL